MPVAVAKLLEKLQKQFFFCGDTLDKKKMHMVSWERITVKKENGGLGIKRLIHQNLALLAKWCWRFSSDKNSLWVKVIRGKYNLDRRSWLPYTQGSGSISNVWRDICSVGDNDSALGLFIREGFKVQVNSGQDTLFWEHTWLGNAAIKLKMNFQDYIGDLVNKMRC